MSKMYIIFIKKKIIVFLFNKIFFFQNIFSKKRNLFIYILKILFNFGFFDFRIFFLLKGNIKLFNGIKL